MRERPSPQSGHSTATLAGLVTSTLLLVVIGVASGAQRSFASSGHAERGNGPAIQPTAAQPEATTWILVWSDEFDGPAGASPDPSIWAYDLGDGSEIGLVGWGNGERQRYTDEPANVATDGEGRLVISAREDESGIECYYGPCEYTSARLLTDGRFEVRYGRIEARIRVPDGFGLWPAFWMLGANIDEVGWPSSGEIDVFEFVGRRPTEILGTLHGPGYSGSSGIGGTLDLGERVADDFHVVAIEWTPAGIDWYVDGSSYHQVSRDDVAPNEWVFDQPFFLLLNVAVGGNLGGPVFPDTAFPASMSVDYVRVFGATDG